MLAQFVAVPGCEQNGHIGALLLKSLRKVQPAKARHHDVGKDEVEVASIGKRQGLFAIAARDDVAFQVA